MSDGRDGILLTHPGWTPRHMELLAILGLPAPLVSPRVAARRHPEAFGWSTRHPRASAVLTVVALAAILVAVIVL